MSKKGLVYKLNPNIPTGGTLTHQFNIWMCIPRLKTIGNLSNEITKDCLKFVSPYLI